MTLTEARDKFLQHCSSAISLSDHTIRAYTSDLDDAQRYFGVDKPLEAVGKDLLRQYIRNMREARKFKETTIKRRLASLKLLFKWALQEEMLTTNPFDTLSERIRLPKRLPRALDRGDTAALRKAITPIVKLDDFEDAQNKVAVRLLLDTGIRVGELTAINIADLSLEDGCVLIQGKGNRQRLVYLMEKPLTRMVEQLLKKRKTVATQSEKLLVSANGQPMRPPSVRVALKRIALQAGIARHVTPHMLRHTCATQWLESGIDIRYVQKLLGHQSISTTEIYTHVSDQGLREALTRARGVGRR